LLQNTGKLRLIFAFFSKTHFSRILLRLNQDNSKSVGSVSLKLGMIVLKTIFVKVNL